MLILNLIWSSQRNSHSGMLFTSKNTVSLHIQAFQFEQEEVTAKLEPLCLRSVVFRDHTHRQPHHRKPQTWTQFQLLIKICLHLSSPACSPSQPLCMTPRNLDSVYPSHLSKLWLWRDYSKMMHGLILLSSFPQTISVPRVTVHWLHLNPHHHMAQVCACV